MTVFLSTEFPQDQAVALSSQLLTGAKSVGIDIKLEFVSRDKALATLKDRAGLNDIVATLGNNPLPDAYIVRLSKPQDAHSAAKIEKLAESFKKLDGVEAASGDYSVRRNWCLKAFGSDGRLRLTSFLLRRWPAWSGSRWLCSRRSDCYLGTIEYPGA